MQPLSQKSVNPAYSGPIVSTFRAIAHHVDLTDLLPANRSLADFALVRQFVDTVGTGLHRPAIFVQRLSSDDRSRLGEMIGEPESNKLRKTFLCALDPTGKYAQAVLSIETNSNIGINSRYSVAPLHTLSRQALFWDYYFRNDLRTLFERTNIQDLHLFFDECGEKGKLEILKYLYEVAGDWGVYKEISPQLIEKSSDKVLARLLADETCYLHPRDADGTEKVCGFFMDHLPKTRWKAALLVLRPEIRGGVIGKMGRISQTAAKWLISSRVENETLLSKHWNDTFGPLPHCFWELPDSEQIIFLEILVKQGRDLCPLMAEAEIGRIKEMLDLYWKVSPAAKDAIDSLDLSLDAGRFPSNGSGVGFEVNLEIMDCDIIFEDGVDWQSPVASEITKPQFAGESSGLPITTVSAFRPKPSVREQDSVETATLREKQLRADFVHNYGFISDRDELNLRIADMDYVELGDWLKPFVTDATPEHFPLKRFLMEMISVIPDREDQGTPDPLHFLSTQLSRQNRTHVLITLIIHDNHNFRKFFLSLNPRHQSQAYLALTGNEKKKILGILSGAQKLQLYKWIAQVKLGVI